MQPTLEEDGSELHDEKELREPFDYPFVRFFSFESQPVVSVLEEMADRGIGDYLRIK